MGEKFLLQSFMNIIFHFELKPFDITLVLFCKWKYFEAKIYAKLIPILDPLLCKPLSNLRLKFFFL